MTEPIVSTSKGPVVPVDAVSPQDLPGLLKKAPAFVRGYAELSEFKARAGQVLTIDRGSAFADNLMRLYDEREHLELDPP